MTETQWRRKKDAPTDGTPIIIWFSFSTGMMLTVRFGEIDEDGTEGWSTFAPIAENGFGGTVISDEDDFLWIPFPQWELAESLGQAMLGKVREIVKDEIRKADNGPSGEE